MRHFPVFLDLAGKPVLVVGRTDAAEAKARQLAAAGAIVGRADDVQEIGSAVLVVVADRDAALAERTARICRAEGVLVNVVDRPEFCDFIWPAIVDRDPVTVAISTGGASPVLARGLRARIEALLPATYGNLARFAGRLRGRVARAIPDGPRRRAFWEAALDGSVAALVLSGDERAAEREIDRALLGSGRPAGRISIVEIATDSTDDLTLGALRLLQEADIVIREPQVGPQFAALARRDCRQCVVGDGDAPPADRLSGMAQDGARIVRLVRAHPESAPAFRENYRFSRAIRAASRPAMRPSPTAASRPLPDR